MPSRKIFLKARPNNTKLPDEVYSEAKRKIGGKITRSGEPLHGLTDEEERKWLAPLLSVSPDDVGYRKKISNFWSDITILVDVKTGIELEIGMDKSGEPINLSDYIKYRYAQKCPEVAEDEKAVRADPTKKYYILDPESKKVEDYASMELRKKAYKEFLNLTDNKTNADRFNYVFRLALGKNPDVYEQKDKELMMEKLSKESPAIFLSYMDRKNIEMEALIAEAVSFEVVQKFGESFSYTDVLLGNSLETTVAFLSDKKNSELLLAIKQKTKVFADKGRLIPQES